MCLKVYLNEMIIVLLDPRCRNKLGVGHEASLQSFLQGRRCSGLERNEKQERHWRVQDIGDREKAILAEDLEKLVPSKVIIKEILGYFIIILFCRFGHFEITDIPTRTGLTSGRIAETVNRFLTFMLRLKIPRY